MVGGRPGCWGGEQGGNSEREDCSRAVWVLRHCQWSIGGKVGREGYGAGEGRVSAFLSSGSFSSTFLLCMISSNED